MKHYFGENETIRKPISATNLKNTVFKHIKHVFTLL